MNGLEKSMTFSRSEVMVKAATARSAFCRIERIGLEIVAELKKKSCGQVALLKWGRLRLPQGECLHKIQTLIKK